MKLAIQGIGLAAPFGGWADISSTMERKPTLDQPVDTSALSDYIPPRRLRRIDHFTRMTLLAAYSALDHAGRLKLLPEDMGIVLSTGYGPSQTTFDFLDSIIEDGAPLASPLAFSHSVHNIPAGVLSLLLGTPCPQTTICQLHQPVISGLRTAALWLAEGRVKNVLFGAVDETTPLLKENRQRLDAEKCRQFTQPGEGAAFFLLNQAESGKAFVDIDCEPIGEPAPALPIGPLPVGAAFSLAAAAGTAREKTHPICCTEGGTTLCITEGQHD